MWCVCGLERRRGLRTVSMLGSILMSNAFTVSSLGSCAISLMHRLMYAFRSAGGCAADLIIAAVCARGRQRQHSRGCFPTLLAATRGDLAHMQQGVHDTVSLCSHKSKSQPARPDLRAAGLHARAARLARVELQAALPGQDPAELRRQVVGLGRRAHVQARHVGVLQPARRRGRDVKRAAAQRAQRA